MLIKLASLILKELLDKLYFCIGPGAVRDLVGVLDGRTPGTVGILVAFPGFSEGAEEEVGKHPCREIILSDFGSIVSHVKRIIEAKKVGKNSENQQLVEFHQENQQLRSEVIGEVQQIKSEVIDEVQQLRSEVAELRRILLVLMISIFLYIIFYK